MIEVAGENLLESRCFGGNPGLLKKLLQWDGELLEVSHHLLCFVKTGLVAGPEVGDDVVSFLLEVRDASGLELSEAGEGGEWVVRGCGGGGGGLGLGNVGNGVHVSVGHG